MKRWGGLGVLGIVSVPKGLNQTVTKDKKFWLRRGDKIIGPFNEGQISKGHRDGKISKTDKVAVNRQGPWYSVEQVVQRFAEDYFSPVVVSNFTFGKSLLGKQYVAYRCPKCKTPLQTYFRDFTENEICPQCEVQIKLPEEVVAQVLRYKAKQRDRQLRKVAKKEDIARRKREEEENKKNLLRQQLAAEKERVARQNADAEEYSSRRARLPESAQVWLRRAESEEYWVRKDFYYLRGYIEAYCADMEEFSRVGKVLLSEADTHDNFKGAKRNCWYALFLTAEAKYGVSNRARLAFEKTETTNVWDGMSCYAIEALYFLLADNYLEHAQAAAIEYEHRLQHNAWLCSHYYTLRAIVVLCTGPIENNPRYTNYFQNIESEYDVWQALVSRTIELFIEIDVF